MLITTAKDKRELEIPVHSIGIAPSTTTFLLHCHLCGKERGQVNGKITRIISWLEPTEQASFIDRCMGCGQHVTFQDASPSKSIMIRISERDRTSFHCPICAKRILTDEVTCVRCRAQFDFRLIEQ